MNFRCIVLAGFFLLLSQSASANRINSPNERCLRVGGNADARDCFLDELRRADRELNQVYTQVSNSLDSGGRQKLVAAQRAWIRFRDLYCAAEVESFGMGSAAGTVDTACRLALTRQQLTNLRQGFD